MLNSTPEPSERLVIADHPLILLPNLAIALADLGMNGTGVNDALVVQQIHYWLKHNETEGKEETHFYEGRWWTYNTVAQWQETFPFWSESTIKRSFERLEAAEIVLVGKFHKNPFNHTKWYSLDYDLIDEYTAPFLEVAHGKILPENGKNISNDVTVTSSDTDSVTSSYTETNDTETSLIIKSNKRMSHQDVTSKGKEVKDKDLRPHERVALYFERGLTIDIIRDSPLSTKQAKQVNKVVTLLGGVKQVYKAIDVWHEAASERENDLERHDLTGLHKFTLAILTSNDLSDLASVFRNYFNSSLERYAAIDEEKKQIAYARLYFQQTAITEDDKRLVNQLAQYRDDDLPNNLDELLKRKRQLWEIYQRYKSQPAKESAVVSVEPEQRGNQL